MQECEAKLKLPTENRKGEKNHPPKGATHWLEGWPPYPTWRERKIIHSVNPSSNKKPWFSNSSGSTFQTLAFSTSMITGPKKIFHQTRFPWKDGAPFLSYLFFGAQIVWGHYDLTKWLWEKSLNQLFATKWIDSKKSPTGPTERTPKFKYLWDLWVSNSSSSFSRGPLVRSYSIFDGLIVIPSNLYIQLPWTYLWLYLQPWVLDQLSVTKFPYPQVEELTAPKVVRDDLYLDRWNLDARFSMQWIGFQGVANGMKDSLVA